MVQKKSSKGMFSMNESSIKGQGSGIKELFQNAFSFVCIIFIFVHRLLPPVNTPLGWIFACMTVFIPPQGQPCSNFGEVYAGYVFVADTGYTFTPSAGIF